MPIARNAIIRSPFRRRPLIGHRYLSESVHFFLAPPSPLLSGTPVRSLFVAQVAVLDNLNPRSTYTALERVSLICPFFLFSRLRWVDIVIHTFHFDIQFRVRRHLGTIYPRP